jgi:3-deoxy-D-arabino-heptulosonate 7-phosphate (DAHP) synthase class II
MLAYEEVITHEFVIPPCSRGNRTPQPDHTQINYICRLHNLLGIKIGPMLCMDLLVCLLNGASQLLTVSICVQAHSVQ